MVLEEDLGALFVATLLVAILNDLRPIMIWVFAVVESDRVMLEKFPAVFAL